ncbi:MAG: winged helix-turn-helix transcriptional regulator [Simkaniaceae bacterium]|nr:winged helix-turn-helix transcriptional regulator [Simkaniaceae bacterium]
MEKILFFLFVNSKGYGMQLSRYLDIPLTSVQKGLARLDRGGIIISYLEGKTRVFRLNPGFPLMDELEQLLKKAYTILPAEMKKQFYVLDEMQVTSQGSSDSRRRILLDCWSKLKTIKNITFHANSKSAQDLGWDGRGSGEVVLTSPKPHTLVFTEKGYWKANAGSETKFSNVFCWTLEQTSGVIALEHLRRGPDRPVFLFHLAPSTTKSLTSVHSHLCGKDAYFGKVQFDQHGLRLNFRIIGPKKNEELEYFYS